MEALPQGTTILLRRGLATNPGRFERLVREIVSQSYHLEARWVMPEPGGGSGAVFDRDNEMVRSADLVLAFFDEDGMKGGTGHCVETAIDRNVPVYSYVQTDSALTRAGEHDPDALWQEQIGAYF